VKSTVAALAALMATVTVGWADDMPLKAPAQAVDQTLNPQPSPWALTTSSEVRYFSWQGNRGAPTQIIPPDGHASGSEIYIPFAAQLVGRPTEDIKVEILGRGGWVWARQNTAGATGEVATTTDTVANMTFTYLGLRGIQPFASVNFNLPTGRSALWGSAANARMDGDFVDISSFGEGFNVGPSFGVSIPITGTLVVTTSAGYTWRGNYQRENSLNALNPNVQSPTTVQPGEVWTANTSIANRWGQWSGSVTGTISWESPTAQDGVPLYKPGDRYVVSGTLSYTWTNGSMTTLNASAAHSNRNEVMFLGASSLIKEPFNTNSDLYRVGLQHLVLVDKLAIGPAGSFVFRDHNGYAPITLQYVPEKERWSAGILARYAATDKVTFNARLDRVWANENEHPAVGNKMFSVLANSLVISPPIPVVMSTGWQAVVGATARF
jgi:hypothetical protein